MNRISFYIILFSIFVSLILSEPNVPLRGTSKVVQKESKSVENNSRIENEKKTTVESVNSKSLNNTKNDISETRELSKDQKTIIYTSIAALTGSEETKCEGNSFVMWFDKGIAITTINCGTYSAIYTGKKSGDPEPRYIQGQVDNVLIESEESIKINNTPINNISKDINEPSENTGSGRLLGTQEPSENLAKAYSFPLEDKTFDVYLPNEPEANNRQDYSLGYKNKVFYKGREKKSEYTLKDGNLVDSKDQVILEKDSGEESPSTTESSSNGTSNEDSTSYAFKVMYVFPSLFAVLISIILF